MMKVVVLACLLTVGAAFRVNNFRPSMVRRMAEEKPVDLVPVDKVNIENAASVTSGVLGLILAGPVGALVFAALGKYVSKKENESGEVLRGVGKNVVEIYNFFTKLNTKYELDKKITETVSKVGSSVDTSNETVATVTKTASTAVAKFDELNKEYDLVSKGKQVVEVAATLSETALEKIEELNAKYDFVETTKKAATVAVKKIRDQVNKE